MSVADPASASQTAAKTLRGDFGDAATATLAALAAALEQTPPFNQRWTIYRQMADIGGSDAVAALGRAIGAEKDSGIRYMTAALLRDLGTRQAEDAPAAAAAIAKTHAAETDAYARRSMELSLADLAAARPATAVIAAAAIAGGLEKPSDTLTRCLQAGQLTVLAQAAPETAAAIIGDVTAAFAAEKDKLAAHHLSRTLCAIADNAELRPQVIATLSAALCAPPSQAQPLEKTFAAAHALHQIAQTAPQEVTQALAGALSTPAQGDNARRLCILGLGAFAAADKNCAQTAATALLAALGGEADALHRRHIVDGVMKAVYNGFSSDLAGSTLYAHLTGQERDRETREKITRVLRSLGHKTPAVPMSAPAPKA